MMIYFYRFIFDPSYLQQNSTLNLVSDCKLFGCIGAVNIGLYNGLLNVTACKFNAPAYVSFPHFYLADPAIMDAFHPDSGAFKILL